jgi:hypothetical protein
MPEIVPAHVTVDACRAPKFCPAVRLLVPTRAAAEREHEAARVPWCVRRQQLEPSSERPEPNSEERHCARLAALGWVLPARAVPDNEMRLLRVEANVRELEVPLLALAQARADREESEQAVRLGRHHAGFDRSLLRQAQVRPRIFCLRPTCDAKIPGGVRPDDLVVDGLLQAAAEEIEAVTDRRLRDRTRFPPHARTEIRGALPRDGVEPVATGTPRERGNGPVDEHRRLDVELPAVPIGPDVPEVALLASVEEEGPEGAQRDTADRRDVPLRDLVERSAQDAFRLVLGCVRAERSAGAVRHRQAHAPVAARQLVDCARPRFGTGPHDDLFTV